MVISIQLYLYNSDLYANFTHALDKPNGILGVALLLKVHYCLTTPATFVTCHGEPEGLKDRRKGGAGETERWKQGMKDRIDRWRIKAK
ncbi:hypothetical protein E2C01_057335 [Portunus trituberculatus]|uniref:Uncharacterized protein n=1 Tax=Portunus trituberculatus TaxID=210409 RepID=A0A5B7GT63_PORTR|nr:hypothetical protein [Portunus trituberculatus]